MTNYLRRIANRFTTSNNLIGFAKNVLMFEDVMSWGSGDLKLTEFLGNPVARNIPMDIYSMTGYTVSQKCFITSECKVI